MLRRSGLSFQVKVGHITDLNGGASLTCSALKETGKQNPAPSIVWDKHCPSSTNSLMCPPQSSVWKVFVFLAVFHVLGSRETSLSLFLLFTSPF